MLDIKLLRESPDVVKADLKKRERDPSVVDRLLEQDRIWREGTQKLNALRAKRNAAAKAMASLSKNRGTLDSTWSEVENLSKRLQEFTDTAKKAKCPRHSQPAEKAESGGFIVKDCTCGVDDEVWISVFEQYLEALEQSEYTLKAYLLQANDIAYYTGRRLPSASIDEFTRLADNQSLRVELLRNRRIEAEREAQGSFLADLGVDIIWFHDEPDIRDALEEGAVQHPDLRALIDQLTQHAQDALRELSKKIKALEKEVDDAESERDRILRALPNIMHESVPVGDDDSENVELRRWPEGDPPTHGFDAASHVDLLDSLDLADLERAARAAGSRFVYLKGDLVMLGRALEFYALQKLQAKGFTPIEPPYMLRREAVEGAVDLQDFEDVIYRVEAGAAAKESKDDAPELFLIATSEHPLAALHMGEILDSADLPLLYAGVSPCFRKEAGAHGKDQKGIFRVHQFSKVEQFVYCSAEDSWDIHEQLIANAEEIYRDLGIPHRVVTICTGDLGSVAAKKYDIEAWMPVQGAYREVVSCSNCTDYQARRYNTRHRANPGDPTAFVHTLNSTAIAVQRTLVAILENFQTADGAVTIPETLRPYMQGKEAIRPVRVQ